MSKKSHFKQHLPEIFIKIEEGKPVHFKRFLLGLAEAGIPPNEVDYIFDVINIGKKRYKVTIKPKYLECYKNIKFKSASYSKVSEKVVAATIGKSHSKSSSGTFGLLHTSEYTNNPYCFVLDEGIARELPKLKRKLLLIENLELFLNYKRIMKFINENTKHKVKLSEFDVMYSQGSMVLNKQFTPFLMSYSEVLCLFDLDFGGIITFSNLKKKLDKTTFLLPDDFDRYIKLYGFSSPKSEIQRLKELLNSENQPKDIKSVIKYLLKTEKKLEQEVYLLHC